MGLPREAFFSLQIVTDQGVEVTDQGGRFSGGDVMPWHRWQLLADQGGVMDDWLATAYLA